MRTLAFRQGGQAGRPYLVLIHTAEAPEAAEWAAYVAQVARAMSVTTGTLHAFIATDGGGPDAAQRKSLTQAFTQLPGNGLSHVFTTSAFVRGIVTTFRWVARAPAVAHVPAKFTAVCLECGLSPADVLNDFQEAQKSFPPVQLLRQIEHSYRYPKHSTRSEPEGSNSKRPTR